MSAPDWAPARDKGRSSTINTISTVGSRRKKSFLD